MWKRRIQQNHGQLVSKSTANIRMKLWSIETFGVNNHLSYIINIFYWITIFVFLVQIWSLYDIEDLNRKFATESSLGNDSTNFVTKKC